MQVLLVFILVVLGIVIVHRLMFRGKTGGAGGSADPAAAAAAAAANATAKAANQARKADARKENAGSAIGSDAATPGTSSSSSSPVKHFRLRGEPTVTESGPFGVEITIDIPRKKADLIVALDAAGALLDDWPDSDRRQASFDAIPDALLPQALFTDGEPVSLAVVINGGRPVLGLWYGYGPLAKIEALLAAFLDAPPGWFELAQERGDFADGKYFTAGHLLDRSNRTRRSQQFLSASGKDTPN